MAGMVATGLLSAGQSADFPLLVTGRLAQGDLGDCLVLHTQGSFNYVLDNYGGYGLGDSVLAIGRFDYPCQQPCDQWEACLHENTVADPGNFEIGCGVITYFECTYLESPVYGPINLDSFHGFAVGDTVSVTGAVEAPCGGVCTWSACVRVRSIGLCSLTSSAPRSWGQIKAVFR
jgi:hypothetical protein